MPDVAIMDVVGARPAKPSQYTSIATLKWIAGYQTQRSPLMSVDTRYNSRYLGGKPDSLIDGSNVELSNKLTLQRRPGLAPYGVSSIPAPDFFYNWHQASLANFVSLLDPSFQTYPQGNLQLIIDTSTNDGTHAPGNIYNYSPTSAGIILNKSLLSQQTSFFTVINTMYMGNGVDLKKLVGTNLLTQSNNFGSGTTPKAPWTSDGTTSFASGATDPLGQTNATTVTFGGTGTGFFFQQTVVPNYTPIASNTYTVSIWMKQGSGANTVHLELIDSNGFRTDTAFVLTTSWQLCQITNVLSNSATFVGIKILNPNTAATVLVYGAQLEVGGPATPTTITLNKPNGVYIWGIQAPTAAPTFTFAPQFGSTGKTWQPGTLFSQTTLTLSSVAATSNGVAVYTGTITGGGSNALAGRYFSITGFTTAANNSIPPGFLCSASTATTLTLNNTAAVAETHAATATLLDTIVDSNGNLEVAYTPGKSGSTEPVWNPTVSQATPDGLQNLVVQSVGNQSNSTTSAAVFPANVTATDTKLILVACSNRPSSGTPGTPTVTDSSTDAPILLAHTAVSNIAIFLYYVLSATAGATTITVTNGGNQSTWVGIAEIANQTATDGNATNKAQMSPNVVFGTGSVTTTGTQDILVTFALFAVPNSTQGYSIGNLPPGFQTIIGQAPTQQGSGFWNMNSGFQLETVAASYNPIWFISNPTQNSNDGYMGITAAFKSSVGSLVWYNVGPKGLTSTSVNTYQYAYSFVNTYTGHRSNISPFSAVTGNFAGQAVTVTGTGMQITPSGSASQDPQVDAIEVYRNVDGGGFWYQIPPSLMQGLSGTITDANGTVYLANPGTSTSPGTWSFIDIVQDSQLNTQIFAPIGFLNSTPPAGLTNLEFFDGRLWGSVANLLYFSTAVDDALTLNILQNGVGAESWVPTNVIPFNSRIVRSLSTGIGLLIFTTTDIWVISGTGFTNYNPIKVAAGIGLGDYNAICIDGSIMMLITRDRQCLMLNISSGFNEIGFVIGDKIESVINPNTAYLARHIKGSQDNAFYLGDGATGWFRLNPNQYGASAAGEQTPIWSPFATITGGCNALASIEVIPGTKELLVGAASGTGPILKRSLTTFTDNGSAYTWFATIGSIVLTLPGELAAIESITTEMIASESTQCAVAVLIDEISGSFETLSISTNDPPQLAASSSVLSNRFFLSPGTVPPLGRHIQIKLSGGAVATQDEILALTIRGEILAEQS